MKRTRIVFRLASFTRAFVHIIDVIRTYIKQEKERAKKRLTIIISIIVKE